MTNLKNVFIVFFLLLAFSVKAQIELAKKYFEDGEFDKAEQVLADLYRDNKANNVYELRLSNFFKSEKYKQAIDLVDEQIDYVPQRKPYLIIDKIWVYKAFNPQAIDGQLAQLDPFLEKNPGISYQLGQSLSTYGLFDLAIKIYSRAQEFAPNMNFSYQKAIAYAEMGDIESMFDEYLEMIDANPSYLNSIKSNLSRSVSADPYNEVNRMIRTSLLKKISVSDKEAFVEMLIWLYLQEGNYSMAFRQYKALEKRGFKKDQELYSMGVISLQNGQLDVAEEVFVYLIQKGPDYGYYYDSRGILLKVEQRKLEKENASRPQWVAHIDKIRKMVDEDDFVVIKPSLLMQIAEVQTDHLKDPQSAYKTLEEALEEPRVSPRIIAQIQMRMADNLMRMDNYVEALLMYARVEKAFETNPIGQEAKFEKAMISYYQGDFEWAKAQFNGLKASPDKLIANDAMNMWLLISSNIDLDTSTACMERFAYSDLLIHQGYDDKAYKILDSLQGQPLADNLLDEILFRKAEIKNRKAEYSQAVSILLQLNELERRSFFKDDGLFLSGKIYEENLGNLEMAKKTYQELFSKYPNSIFSKEARERFRRLRGDQI